MNYRYLLVPFFVFLMILSSVMAEEQDLGPKNNLFRIDGIKLRGLKKVEREAILEKIGSKKGMMLDNYLLRRDIRKIYRMKYFDGVEAHHEKSKGNNYLVFSLKEKPIISEIKIVGNSDVDQDEIKTHIKTKEFGILDVNTLKSDTKALEKFYEEKGFYLATVEYKVEPFDKNTVRVTYQINEFDKVRVKKVTFLGNKAFSDKELKGIMETREDSLFSFMTGSGSFKDFGFQTDIERVKYFYKSKGHLQVNVANPEVSVSEDKKWMFITIRVNEGPKFLINGISFQGELLFEDKELMEKITLKEGMTYSEDELRKDINLLTELYQDKGYAFANVLRTLRVVPGENKVDVQFSFEKGEIAYFGDIRIKGNSKTRDKVIRRELKIEEGRKYSGSALRRSKENVNRLGFFEPKSVIFNTITRDDQSNVLDIEISVKERNTGQISLGAGYSSASGGFMNASIAQKNFMGLGQELSFGLTLSEKSETYNIGFTEPYLFDTKWTAGANVYSTKNEYSDDYSYKRRGGDILVGYPIFDYTRLFLTFKNEYTKIENSEDEAVDTDLENGTARSITTTIKHDRRNNAFEPSKGFFVKASLEYAGLLGDKKWLRSTLDGRYYKSIIGDLVLRTRFYGAKLNKVEGRKIPRTEKFSLGGAKNMRGYAYEAIGPKRTVFDDSKNKFVTYNDGGLFSAFTSWEVEHPLAREAGLKWVLFMDAGNVFPKYIGKNGDYELYADYGFGFRWFSPIGVLRFEWGRPLSHNKENGGSQFHFDLGQLF